MTERLLAERVRPAILVAGNGHVRTDYGVPQILTVLSPEAKVVSIAFVESESLDPAPYDYLWKTEAAERNDPCTGFGNRQ